MTKKDKILIGLVAGLLITNIGTAIGLASSKTNANVEIAELTKKVTELKKSNGELERTTSALKENTKDKGQDAAKLFVSLLAQSDSKSENKDKVTKLKSMVTGEAEQKLTGSGEDSHGHGEEGKHRKTSAEIQDMYYTKTADDKADVIVKYTFIVDIDGTIQKESHVMKMNMTVKDTKWLVENFDFRVTEGIEGF
ncbi:hypothetical protein [Bacillus mycoides]|uniref:hypothetical protein n=1 Tax=Bacillus mycoides TaxID=1405 RepID=UPI003A7FC540